MGSIGYGGAVIDEAAAVDMTPPKQNQVRRAGYEYGIPIGGSNASSQAAFSAERLQILTQLYQAYLTCPWLSGPIDLIARTATAGGLQVVYDDPAKDKTVGAILPDDPPEVLRLRRLLRFTNPREDMIQMLRSVATDLWLFGDAYIEIVWLLGEPVALYGLDATTMTVICDEHGEVTGYMQNVDGLRIAQFETGDVIHISLDAPRGGVYGVAPAQKALLPVTAWLFTEATIKENFRRGDPPRIHADLGNISDTDAQRWREQYQVYNLGPKAVGNPIVTLKGGAVTDLQSRKVTDYLEASRQLRDEIVSCMGVPPAKIGIIESGNLGGGTGEQQDKTFRVNTIIPLQALILEKLNYTLVQVGFGISNWRLDFGEIDYRDSKVIEDIRDMRLRNGSWTINRYRDEIDEPPVDGGDEAVIIDRQNMVLVRDLASMSQAGIAAKLKGSALEPDEPVDGQPMTIHKPEPKPTPPALAPFTGQTLPVAGRHRAPEPQPDGLPDPLADDGDGNESAYDRDNRRLSESWQHAYRKRRRLALEAMPKLSEIPDAVTTPGPDLPTDPYWDADAHNHNDVPDYTATDLGVDELQRVIVDPRDIRVDHSYQRPQHADLVRKYAAEPRQRLGERVGLLAIRPDGSMWCVDGQHHTAAAVIDHMTAMTYQQFHSTGPLMEAAVYKRLHDWHGQLHKKDTAANARFGPKQQVKGMPANRRVGTDGVITVQRGQP